MADYYPLLAKAVAGLPDPTPQARSAIYERARNAMIRQLRRLDPPIPEAEIARESSALEVAVARLEAEFAPPAPQQAAPESGADLCKAPLIEEAVAVVPAAVEAPAPPTPPSEPEAPIQPASSGMAAAASEPVAAPPQPPTAADAKGEEPSSGPPSPRSPMFFKVRRDKPAFFPPASRVTDFSARRPANSTSAFRLPAVSPVSRSSSKPVGDGSLEPPAQDHPSPDGLFGEGARPIPESGVPEAPPPWTGFDGTDPQRSEAEGSFEAESIARGALASDVPDAAADLSQAEYSAEAEPPERPLISAALAKQRPFAPRPLQDSAKPRRLWIVGFVVGLLVFLVAIAAFELRDRPEELRQKAPLIVPEVASNGKIIDRVTAGPDTVENPPAPTSDTTAAQSTAGSNSPAPVSDQTAHSARRAALLVEASDEPSKVKTYLGAVVWKVDNVSNGPGDPLSMAVQAEVDIPEEKLQALVTLRKNFDSSLPASHTIKIQFVEPADSPLGGVQQISVPQMRREEVATGDALKGVPVSVTDNSFLVGLTKGSSEADNLDLLKSREWIDVPMLLSNGKIAKLTFEKGPAGDRAIEDAFASWSAQ
jgi:hypothetical protein